MPLCESNRLEKKVYISTCHKYISCHEPEKANVFAVIYQLTSANHEHFQVIPKYANIGIKLFLEPSGAKKFTIANSYDAWFIGYRAKYVKGQPFQGSNSHNCCDFDESRVIFVMFAISHTKNSLPFYGVSIYYFLSVKYQPIGLCIDKPSK